MTKQFRNGGLSILRFLKHFAKEKILAKKAFIDYFAFVNRIHSNYGTTQTIKILKEINLRARHYAAGYPRGDGTFGGIWFKICKVSRLPKKVSSLKDFIDKETNTALLIPNFVYSLNDRPNYNISTLEDEDKSSLDEDDIKLFAWHCKMSAPKLKLAKIDHLFTCKGGPNGPSALSHAQDLLAVQNHKFSRTYVDLIRSIYGENSWLEETYQNFSADLLTNKDYPNLKFRNDQKVPIMAKLEFCPAPAGKTRIVYVGNWWVQALLLPIHESMMNQFARMANDATWDQNLGVELISKWSSEKSELFSFDLTAATDRWPIKHQRLVIEACFDKNVADVWEELLSIPAYSKKHKRYITYKVGQPMGLFSSWAALNMSHHCVLRYLSWRFKRPRKYMILGDDIVIADKILAMAYLKYMNNLGVMINESKSILYEQGKPHSAEFARNIIRDGKSIGCVSPNILNELLVNKNYAMSLEFLRELHNKYSIDIYVDRDKTLLPISLSKFFDKKCVKEIIFTLTVDHKDFEIPVIRKDPGFYPDNRSDYIEIKNPWSLIDEDEDLQDVIKRRYILESYERAVALQSLFDNISVPGNSVCPGFALEIPSHPIRYLLRSIESEIVKTLTVVIRGKGVTPYQITTSIDLLISILTKGIDYRQWRNSQVTRHTRLMKFFKTSYKKIYDSQERYFAGGDKEYFLDLMSVTRHLTSTQAMKTLKVISSLIQ
jgi:hypothetical protein